VHQSQVAVKDLLGVGDAGMVDVWESNPDTTATSRQLLQVPRCGCRHGKKGERIASDDIMGFERINHCDMISFMDECASALVTSVETQEFTPLRWILGSLVDSSPPESHEIRKDLIRGTGISLEGDQVVVLVTPHSAECSFGHDKISGFEIAGREQTTATIRSTWLDSSIDGKVSCINSQLTGDALLDIDDVVRALSLLAEAILDFAQ
jgi:hypothetical protein